MASNYVKTTICEINFRGSFVLNIVFLYGDCNNKGHFHKVIDVISVGSITKTKCNL